MSVWWWALAIALACPTCGVTSFFALRSYSPYDAAVERATGDARVVKLLGDPVSASTFFRGSFKLRGSNGLAHIEIDLEGSTQTGVLEASGVETSEVWGFSVLRVRAANGATVSLVKE